MKFHYYPETDSLYVDLSEKPSVESVELSRGIVVDYDEEGNVVGFDIDHASKLVELSKIETYSLPLDNISMSA